MQAILVTTFPCLVHCFVSSIIDFVVASFPRLPARPSCFRDGKKVPNEYGQFYRPVSLKTVWTTNIICLDLFPTFLLGSRLTAILTSLEPAPPAAVPASCSRMMPSACCSPSCLPIPPTPPVLLLWAFSAFPPPTLSTTLHYGQLSTGLWAL